MAAIVLAAFASPLSVTRVLLCCCGFLLHSFHSVAVVCSTTHAAAAHMAWECSRFDGCCIWGQQRMCYMCEVPDKLCWLLLLRHMF
jgi:hypothetical protein